ncbi:MAG: hypothetical protein ABIJ47_11875 [Candidatus Bathyarchaeota archaeon]
MVLVILLFMNVTLVIASDIVFSLEPEVVQLPYLENEWGSVFILELKVTDVEDLKEFHIDFAYDKGIIDYIVGDIDRSFYVKTGGWVGNSLDGELAKSFTGTSIMFHYIFRVVDLGTTTIRLQNAEFFDSEGNSIDYVKTDCTVNVVEFSEYVNVTYRNLIEEHDELTFNYTQLQANYDQLHGLHLDLESELASLESENDDLASENMELQSQINTIESDIEDLTTQIKELQSEIERLESQQIPGFPLMSLIVGLVGIVIFAYMSNCRGS